jgi:cytoskeletal protein RodZ
LSSFGETLRRERELRGIDLREVAEATKISVRFLQALENGRLDILPGGIFPRAFVRQYAAYLGLDPERTVAEFMYSQTGTASEPMPAVPGVAPVRRTRPLPVGLALGALALLLLGLVAWRQLRQSASASAPVTAAATTPPAPAATPFAGDRVFPPPAPVSGPGVVAPSEGLVLDITANKECWVAVQADGVRIIDRVLARGETQRLNAHREIVLSVGNAGGIAFRINGRNGVALGKDGEVRRNIVITHQSLPSLLEGAAAPPPAAPPRSG